jgi:hypothetical protein
VLVGVYIIYMSLVVFAADGMFDAVPFLFGLLAVLSFLSERYDVFLFWVGVSILLKYQVAIFLFPLVLIAVAALLEKSRIRDLVRDKFVVFAAVFAVVSGVTAYLSLPYLLNTRAELVMNGINAFSPNAQINWPLQSTAVLLTLAGTLVTRCICLTATSCCRFRQFSCCCRLFCCPTSKTGICLTSLFTC